MKKHYAKLLHLGVGVHSFGAASTLIAKPGKLTLEVLPLGILCTQLEHKKKALVPWSNIKAFELPFDSDFGEEEKVVVNALSALTPRNNKDLK